MKLYPEEWKAFESFIIKESSSFPLLSQEQKSALLSRAAELKNWQQKHPLIHNSITVTVVLFNLGLLITIGFIVPSVFKISLFEQVLLTILYGHTAYGLTVFSLHELNGHNQGIKGEGKIAQFLDLLCKSACRLNHADPVFYKTQHYSHHQQVGTQEDKAFTNAISIKRFLISIIPFAVATPFCDYKIHTDDKWSKSKAISEILATSLLLGVAITLYLNQSWIHALIFVVLAPWSSFLFDRLRETSEHNFMPNTKGSEARSFGVTFWGLIVGGGPWGQCCHLMHHIAPTLPWYFQITLQKDFEKMLDEKQKRVFLRGGVVDYLKLWKEILKKQNLYFSKNSGL
jgi:fatty-acid desaturase